MWRVSLPRWEGSRLPLCTVDVIDEDLGVVATVRCDDEESALRTAALVASAPALRDALLSVTHTLQRRSQVGDGALASSLDAAHATIRLLDAGWHREDAGR